MSEEDYAVRQTAWTEKGMLTLRDFLVWYNNLDVVPFLEALDKMSQFWRRYGVDMLKEAISYPGWPSSSKCPSSRSRVYTSPVFTPKTCTSSSKITW